MTLLRILSLVIIIVTVYIVNVESQTDTGKQTTSSDTTNIVTNEKTGNPKAEALTDSQANSVKTTAQSKASKQSPPKRRKVRRRPRKRRPPPKRAKKNRPVKNRGGKVTASDANSKASKEKTAPKIIIAPKTVPAKKPAAVATLKTVVKVKAAPQKPVVIAKAEPVKAEVKAKAEPVKAAPLKAVAKTKSEPVKTEVKVKAATLKTEVKAKAEPVKSEVNVKAAPLKAVAKTKSEPKKTEDKTKAAENAGGFGMDPFFDLFETTTVEPLLDVPPPDFIVNKIPGAKVLPKVDTENAKAYDGTPCSNSYRNHETDKTKYKMKDAEGGWATVLKCPPNLGSGLVWRQDLCSCGVEIVPVDPNDGCAALGFSPHLEKRHKYVRNDQGVNVVMDCAASLVWSQDKCLCLYDTTVQERPIEQQVTFVCKTILQMEFEGNLKNTARGYHIQPVKLRRRGILRIQYRKVPGSRKKAALIVSQPLEFLAFRGNDFQKQVTYALSFKISPRHRRKDNFMVLLTDECLKNPRRQNKARKPSIKLAFQPNTKTFHLQFRTKKTEVDHLIKGAKPDTYGWYKTVVYLEDKTLSMEVNGVKVFSQTDVMGKMPQNKCPLYIAGRGRGFNRSQDFYGYLDNVSLVKDCKFHEANIKFL